MILGTSHHRSGRGGSSAKSPWRIIHVQQRVSNLVTKYKLLHPKTPSDPSSPTILQGDVSNIYSQRFVLGQDAADCITIPLHLRLRRGSRAMRNNRISGENSKSGGWVTWFDEDSQRLSSTTVAQWNAGTRERWLTGCNEVSCRSHLPPFEVTGKTGLGSEQHSDAREVIQSVPYIHAAPPYSHSPSGAHRSSGCHVTTDFSYSSGSTKLMMPPFGTSGTAKSSTSGETIVQSRRSRVLHLFVFLHGLSAPSVFESDVVENFGNLISTLLEAFPRAVSKERGAEAFPAGTVSCDNTLFGSHEDPKQQGNSTPSSQAGNTGSLRDCGCYTVEYASLSEPFKEAHESECPCNQCHVQIQCQHSDRGDIRGEKGFKAKRIRNIIAKLAAKLTRCNKQRCHESVNLAEVQLTNQAQPTKIYHTQVLESNANKTQEISAGLKSFEASSSARSSGPASLLFVSYSYRKATWKSIDACISSIVPRFCQELRAHTSSWDEVRLYAIGHSLGGLLWRFLLLTRLQQVIHPMRNLTERRSFHVQYQRRLCQVDYKDFNEMLQHHRIRLMVFCTLASPHLGAFKSSLIYRSMPEAIAGLKYLPNSHYAQDLLLRSDEGLLATLATEELAGRSHLTFPKSKCIRMVGGYSSAEQHRSYRTDTVPDGKNVFINYKDKAAVSADSDYNQSTTKEGNTRHRGFALCDLKGNPVEGDCPDDKQTSVWGCARATSGSLERIHPHAVNRFARVLLYGIIETDWIVSIHSALATMADIRRSKEGFKAIHQPMHPVCVNKVAQNCQWIYCSEHARCCFGTGSTRSLTNSVASSIPGRHRKIEQRLARQHIHVFDHVNCIQRYAVYIDENPVFLAPHGMLKGSSDVVSKDRQRHVLKKAKPILTHIASHILTHQSE